MLDEDQAATIARDLWTRQLTEQPRFDKFAEYFAGRRGIPDVEPGASEELKELARISVKNVLPMIIESFNSNLSVTGYRTKDNAEQDAGWEWWQQQRLDARQDEVHRPCLKYGVSYLRILPELDEEIGRVVGQATPRSPRQLFTMYENPEADRWPVYALDQWVEATSSGSSTRRALLIDDEASYPMDLGNVPIGQVVGDPNQAIPRMPITVRQIDEPMPHDRGHCPVVRFINERDPEQMLTGEIEPLIVPQRALNAANFDRLSLARFGAYPQKVIIGWTGKTREETLRAAASRVWAFEDGDVKAQTLQPGSIGPYNELIEEMIEHIATVAQVPVANVTGKMVNLSAEALAAANSIQQRKIVGKRDSLGESWEQAIAEGAAISGIKTDPSAEVIWRNTDVQPYATVIDGIVKLQSAGIPIEVLVQDVPGWTQQQIQQARNAIASGEDVQQMISSILQPATPPTPTGAAA